jgi:cytochrome c553
VNIADCQPILRRSRSGRGILGLALALPVLVSAAGPAVAEDPATVATTVCVACHGDNGNSVVPMFPKIAGLQEAYIFKQLKEFKLGQRKSDVMAPIVANLTADELAPLARHFSAQKANPGEVHDTVLAQAGKAFYQDGNEDSGVPACIGCHQPEGAGYSIYPRLAGQHPEYVLQQLKNFAVGDRSNDVSRYMRTVARRMTEPEMKAVAEYIGSIGAK